MNARKQIGALFLGTLILFSPLIAVAGATDTSDACPVGQVVQTFVDSGGGLGQSTGCVPIGSEGAPVANAQTLAQQTVPDVPECTGTFSSWSFSCLWNSAITSLAALLISIAVTIMVALGELFNIAINQTVLGFNGWIGSETVLKTIQLGWTFFRDLANILIIGLFVFIAINMILGNKSYGERKLIARVLIVAVLLNFSFLFTRIVINFSNAIAVQFAQQLGGQPAVGIGPPTPPDIAGKFTDLMGVKSWKDTKDTLQKISRGSGLWVVLMHAIVVVIISLAVSLVLLYGALLLLMRAIIFIFLLITSSVAFATYLHPDLAKSDFGWTAWWGALLRNAILAPIMMLFLVITLNVSNGLVCALNPSMTTDSCGTSSGGDAAGGVLGALASHPEDPKNIQALLIYAAILGLLYGAIRISNKFSGAAGQFASAGTLPFANATVAWPSRSLGFLGRNTFGRGASALGGKLQDKAKAAYTDKRVTSGFTWDTLARGVKSVAKRDFNAGNFTNIKSAQTPKAVQGGFDSQEKRRKDEISARAKRNTYTDEELKASKDALKKARDEVSEDGHTKRGDAYDKNRKEFEGAKKLEEAAKKQLDTATKSAEAIGKQIKTLESKRDAATAENKAVIEKTIDGKKGDMKAATDAIARAETDARQHSERAVNLELDGQNIRGMLDRRAAALMPKGKEYLPYANTPEGAKPFNERAGEIAVEDAFKRFSNVLNRTAGITTRENDTWAQSLRKKTKDDIHHDETAKSVKDLAKQIQKLGGHADHAADQAHDDAAHANDNLKEIKRNSAEGH